LFAPHGVTADLDLPVAWNDPIFLPYDWGYFAFVYDQQKTETVPASFNELAASDLKIIVQDPRTSTPGLGLLLWVESAYGDQAEDVWENLADNILTVTKGWSEAYGLFLDGEADMVLSYTTSPAYHIVADEDDSKAAAAFTEGHYMQIEVAAKVASSDVPELADRFMAFMVSDDFQNIIPTTNWMYPAVALKAGLPEGFATLIKPDAALIFSSADAAKAREGALQKWLTALSR
jgi:thiamine transport system substrate-binding protein